MTMSDVEAWADRAHVSCDEMRNGSVLHCKNVPERALGGRKSSAVDELDLAFSPTARLAKRRALAQKNSGQIDRNMAHDARQQTTPELRKHAKKHPVSGDPEGRRRALLEMRQAEQHRLQDNAQRSAATECGELGLEVPAIHDLFTEADAHRDEDPCEALGPRAR